LHVKDVGDGILLEKLLNIECDDYQNKLNMYHSLSWLRDNSAYESFPKKSAYRCPKADMSHDDILQLENVGVVRQIQRSEVKGFCKMFNVVEHFKKRRRPIKNTVDINDFFGKETLRKFQLISKNEICNLVNQGTHFAQFDCKAWYDQLPYGPGVGEHFCFRSGGNYYCLGRLAMGQRQAVEVAQSITEVLLDFPGRRCQVARGVIDNVIFVGSYEDVLHDGQRFVERCNAVRALINDPETFENGIDKIIQTSGEWCGVHLDMVDKTVKLTEKTYSKFEVSWNNRENWTWRQFAAHIGLLFWTWGLLDIPVQKYYPLLRFLSESSRLLQADESLWDKKATIHASAMEKINEWTALAIANAPRKVKLSSPASWFISTDASKWGWGYVAFNAATGEIRSHGQQWNKQQLAAIFAREGAHKMRKSVYSEPLGVILSFRRLLHHRKQDEVSVTIPDELRCLINVACDNVSTVHLFNKGFATRSYDINKLIEELLSDFPKASFDIRLVHVDGKNNLGDGFSRGKLSSGSAEIGHKTVEENFQRIWAAKFDLARNSTGRLAADPI
jgi:hypothetical protein